MVRGLHRMWGYTPEEALNAPVWVTRMSALLAFDDDLREKQAS